MGLFDQIGQSQIGGLLGNPFAQQQQMASSNAFELAMSQMFTTGTGGYAQNPYPATTEKKPQKYECSFKQSLQNDVDTWLEDVKC